MSPSDHDAWCAFFLSQSLPRPSVADVLRAAREATQCAGATRCGPSEDAMAAGAPTEQLDAFALFLLLLAAAGAYAGWAARPWRGCVSSSPP